MRPLSWANASSARLAGSELCSLLLMQRKHEAEEKKSRSLVRNGFASTSRSDYTSSLWVTCGALARQAAGNARLRRIFMLVSAKVKYHSAKNDS